MANENEQPNKKAMKQILLLFIVAAFYYACGNNNPTTAPQIAEQKDSVKAAPEKVDSLTSKYIQKFEIGDAAYAQKVFDYYKNYDANTLDSARDDFADTVVLNLADGSTRNFARDSLIIFLKKERSAYQSSLHITDAFVALKNTNDTGVWVSIWERKVDVLDNKKNISLLNENWKFTAGGKMVFLRQYTRKFVGKN